MIDALETAQSFGLSLSPRSEALQTQVDFDPYQGVTFDEIVPAFIAITVAVNSPQPQSRTAGHLSVRLFGRRSSTSSDSCMRWCISEKGRVDPEGGS